MAARTASTRGTPAFSTAVCMARIMVRVLPARPVSSTTVAVTGVTRHLMP